ncbi:MAG: TRAP transporter small permease subunit [Gammaproteobacteria bacterium]|nr:TRAP transporter small permease subunit [Gammaproteobacteria bacterium]
MTEKVPDHLEVADELIAEGHMVSRETIPDDMAPWMANSILAIDTFSRWTGFVVAWLILPLCFAMVYEVVARKFFLAPTMWAFDISRFLYGAMFTLGAAYALAKGVHIRADFIYRNWSPKAQGRVDLGAVPAVLFSRSDRVHVDVDRLRLRGMVA